MRKLYFLGFWSFFFHFIFEVAINWFCCKADRLTIRLQQEEEDMAVKFTTSLLGCMQLLFYESFKSLEKRALSEIKCKTVAVVVSVESEQRVDGCKWTRGKRTTSQPSQPLPHPFHSVPPMLLKASGNFKVNRGGYNFFVCRYFFERRGRMVCWGQFLYISQTDKIFSLWFS